jgi:cytochrome c oxidase subunit 1
LAFIVNVLWSRRSGEIAGDDPWQAGTLEWATTSPPPSYNFPNPPTVQSGYPLWESLVDAPVVVGLSTLHREVLVTTAHDARPDHRYHMAGNSIWPVILSLVCGAMMIGLIFHPYAFASGFVCIMLTLAGWFWPTNEPEPVDEHYQAHERELGLSDAHTGILPATAAVTEI